MNELLKQAQAEIDKAIAGSVIIQNANQKSHNSAIWRGLEQNTKALSELSKLLQQIGNPEQLKKIKPKAYTKQPEKLTCNHPHWERQETGTQLIHKICSTCGAEKFD